MRFRGDVKAVVWRLVDSAAVAERSDRLNSIAQPSNGVSPFPCLVLDTEKLATSTV